MTQIDQGGVNTMRKLFSKHEVPLVDFSHWTAEYGREVWEIVSLMTKEDTKAGFVEIGVDPYDELIKLLDKMDVFAEGKELQQWKPPGAW